MTHQTTLAILAGGASRRMGHPKHLLATPRGTVVEHLVEQLSPLFSETLLVAKDAVLAPDGVRFVRDARPERSPLVGIYSALLATETPTCLVVGCDMPFVLPALVRGLVARSAEFDVVVPRVGGFYEPLLAVYRTSCARAIEAALAMGIFRITSIYRTLRVLEVPEETIRRIDPELVSLTNLNTPKELDLLARL